MDDELVLLTSYFNLAGGRRNDNADTFRVEPSVQSPSSPDGVAALYVVTESSSGGQMGPRARRLAANTVAWEYASHGDMPPSARLKAALKTCHEAILQEFEGHVSVGMSVIAVERDSIYLAQAAPGQVYVLHEGALNSITAGANGTSAFARALGSSAGPKIAVYRDQIAPGDVLALCPSWFYRAADPDELRESFAAPSADEIAESILDLAKQHDLRDATAIVIEVALASELEEDEDDEDRPPGFVEQLDMAVSSLAGVGRMLWDEFRTVPPIEEVNGDGIRRRERDREPTAAPVEAHAVAAEPETAANGARPGYADDATMEMPQVSPEVDAGASDDGATAEPHLPGRHDRTWEGQTEEIPAVPPTSRGSMDDLEPAADGWSEPETAREDAAQDLPTRRGRRRRGARSIIRQERQSQPEPEPQPHPEPAYRSEIEQVNARIQSDPEIGDAAPPVQAFPDTSTEPSRIYATSKDIQAINRRPRRFGGRDALASSAVIRPGGLSDIDLRQPVRRPTPGWVTWAGAILVFLLFVVAVAVYLNHRHHTVAINPYPALFQKDIRLALAAKAPAQQTGYLTRAKTNMTLAGQHGSTAAQLRTMQATWQSTSDTINHITRETSPITLSDFTKFPGARPTEIATAPGLVFVLDAGRKSVFSVTPNATSNPAEIVQAGESDSNFTVGIPQQIASAGSTALVLDDHSVLVRDSAGTKTATSLTAGDPNMKVTAMTSTGPDVYLLDTGSGQLWRYPYGVAGFNPPPQAFFSPTKPDLSHTVSLAFDGKSLFLLDSNGTIRKFDFLTANPQAFALHLPAPLKRPVALSTGANTNFIFIADPGTGRIVQVDKSGNYMRTYVSGTPAMHLNGVQSISVGPAGNTIYVLSGSKLYDFSVQR